MELDPVTAYVAVVRPDRTVRLPENVPVGATVAVVLLPGASAHDDEARRERFERTLEALRTAAARGPHGPAVDDEALDALIDRARRS